MNQMEISKTRSLAVSAPWSNGKVLFCGTDVAAALVYDAADIRPLQGSETFSRPPSNGISE